VLFFVYFFCGVLCCVLFFVKYALFDGLFLSVEVLFNYRVVKLSLFKMFYLISKSIVEN
jgi:hypothetical protein